MKNLFPTVLMLMGSLQGFSQNKTWQDLETLLKNGSSREIMRFCGDTIIIKIDGESGKYSKSEAEMRLRDFFSANPAQRFSYVHHGSSVDGLNYSIGKYSMEEGSYRVVMFLKENENGFQLESISLTSE